MNSTTQRIAILLVALCGPVPTAIVPTAIAEEIAGDWLSVGGDRGCQRYSTCKEINRDNVDRLQVAWTYRTGELKDGVGKTIECTPIVIDGTMFITTAERRVVALDAATGQERWRFDPLSAGPHIGPLASGGVNRGAAYWSDGRPGGMRRVLHGTSDGRLFSLDAATGRLDPAFGKGGVKDLREDLERKIGNLPYGPTSAPGIFEDLVILGFSNGEGPGIAAPGDVRAFDVRSGQQRWRFRTVPIEGEVGYETWAAGSTENRGGANAWGGISIDVERGLALFGLGSATFDFYGGDRAGENLFANCVVAVDARTGQRRWHFQTLHHDLWDHDLPVYPNVVSVERDGKSLPAAAQVTKTGHVFVLNLETGEPLFDVEEKPVPANGVPGEQVWPTQPIPVKPPPFSAQHFDESNATDIATANRDFVLEKLKPLRRGPAFLPPSFEGSVVIPGFHGGSNWSGAAFDPETKILYLNSTNMPNIVQLKPSTAGAGYRYEHAGYTRFVDQEGYPAIQPPWGQLNAIDLSTGEFVWRSILGEHVELTKRGIPPTGTENFGGAIVTAGGLVFIAGTKDERIRAFDKSSGQVLWEHELPAGGYATPATYAVAGKQYVVIAAGGAGKLGTRAGDAFVAFALPQ